METARSQEVEERQERGRKNVPEVGDEAEYWPDGSVWVNGIQIGVQSDDANTSEDENVPELRDEADYLTDGSDIELVHNMDNKLDNGSAHDMDNGSNKM